MRNEEFESLVQDAYNYCKKQRYKFFDADHLLFFVLKHSDLDQYYIQNKIDKDVLFIEIEVYINLYSKQLAANENAEPIRHGSLAQFIKCANTVQKQIGTKSSYPVCFVLAFIKNYSGRSTELLRKNNVDCVGLTAYLCKKCFAMAGNDLPTQSPALSQTDSLSYMLTEPPKNCISMNNLASLGRYSTLIGREKELNNIIETLLLYQKNNPLLIGESGVGKTTIVEGLAQRIISGDVPERLKNRNIFKLDVLPLISGTRYRGDFEEKMQSLVASIREIPGCIVFIDELHTLMGLGASSSKLDGSSIIQELLLTKNVSVIGTTTTKEYREHIEKDSAFSRRFNIIHINEPTVSDTKSILHGLKKTYEEHHNVVFSNDSIDTAVKLSEKYITNQHFPDKALDLLDKTASEINLSRTDLIGPVKVNKKSVEETLSKKLNLVPAFFSQKPKEFVEDLKTKLKAEIFGQDSAIEEVVHLVLLNRLKLRGTTKTMGNLLFVGPTGVGKTELCVQLSKNLHLKLLRYDMGEYSESHSVSKLFGSPPGYVGHNEGGLLTEAVNKHPHSIVLLDEIEKAHPVILNALLQILDYGFATDSNGRKIDFRHTFIIMTSNIGASDLEKNNIGFGELKKDISSIDNQIERTITPEFRNRLDSIIKFNYLTNDLVKNIIDNNINKLTCLLKENDSKINKIHLSKKLYDFIIENGYNKLMGARSIERVVSKYIKSYIAQLLLTDNVKRSINLTVTNGKITHK